MTEENSFDHALLELPTETMRLHERLSKMQRENFLLRRQLSSSMALLDIAVGKLASLGLALETPLDLRKLRAEAQHGAPPLIPATLVPTSSPPVVAATPSAFIPSASGTAGGENNAVVSGSGSSGLRGGINAGPGLGSSSSIPSTTSSIGGGGGNVDESTGVDVGQGDHHSTHGKVSGSSGGGAGGGSGSCSTHAISNTTTVSSSSNISSKGSTVSTGQIGGGGGEEGGEGTGNGAGSSLFLGTRGTTSSIAVAGITGMPTLPTYTPTSSSTICSATTAAPLTTAGNTSTTTLAPSMSKTGVPTSSSSSTPSTTGAGAVVTSAPALTTGPGASSMTTTGGAGVKSNCINASGAQLHRKNFTLFNVIRNAHSKSIHCCGFAPGSQHDILATGGLDGRLILHPFLEVSKGGGEGSANESCDESSSLKHPVLGIPSAHTECISDLSWLSPHLIATASFDSSVRVWDVNRGILCNRGRRGRAVDEDNIRVRGDASRSSSGTDAGCGGEERAEALIYEFTSLGLMLACCSLQKPHLFACSNSHRQVCIIDTRAPVPSAVVQEWSSRVNSLAYDGSCHHLFMGHSDGVITAWDLRKVSGGGGAAGAPSTNPSSISSGSSNNNNNSYSAANMSAIEMSADMQLSSTLPPSGSTTDGEEASLIGAGSTTTGNLSAGNRGGTGAVKPGSQQPTLRPPPAPALSSSSLSSWVPVSSTNYASCKLSQHSSPSLHTGLGASCSNSSFLFSSSSMPPSRMHQLKRVWSTTDPLSHSGVTYIAHVNGEDHSKRLVSVTSGNVVRLYKNSPSVSPPAVVNHPSSGGGGGGVGGVGVALSLGGGGVMSSFVTPPSGSGGSRRNTGASGILEGRGTSSGTGRYDYYLLDTSVLPSSPVPFGEEEEQLQPQHQDKDIRWTGNVGGTIALGGGEYGEGLPMRAAFWKGISRSYPRSSFFTGHTSQVGEEKEGGKVGEQEVEDEEDHEVLEQEGRGEKAGEEVSDRYNVGHDGEDAEHTGRILGSIKKLGKNHRREGVRGMRANTSGGNRSIEGKGGSGGYIENGSSNLPYIAERDLLVVGGATTSFSNGMTNHRALVYDVSDSRKPCVVDTLDGHLGQVTGAAIKRVGEHIVVATTSADCTVRIWMST